MGELKVANSNGVVSSEAAERSGLGFERWKSPPPDTALITEESLSAAEEAGEKVLNCVHPRLDSEEKRRDVIDYVQQLVKSRLNCEAVSYGSVPLKTYLPDGDIDLTILKGPNAEESLATNVFSLLEDEEQNQNAEYQVTDTQFIDAEVKLVKCLVQNIVVDITFNQLGGLSTLCFLEQVDRIVGRNHLFKRSIILVKTWCYYESRILGAHHGLISTYALETLVLYIFHFFHASLSGPLAVLYKFLDYYSQFDWENYCISLKGPVLKSSLPDIIVKIPENGCNSLLLSEEFLENCMELFSVPSRGTEANQKVFQPKHLNIIDPLKENNNLGRSVHRGNFYRIRSAFKYGAHKLGQVLLCPKDEVADKVRSFFSNTCARHEHQHTSFNRHLALEFSDEESLTASLSSPVGSFSDDDMFLKSSASDFDNDSDGGVDYSLSHSKSSTENGSSEDQQIYLADSDKFGINLWLENRDEQTELNYKLPLCMDNPEAVCNCKTGFDSTPKANILEKLSLDFRETDSISVGEESEAFNPLANLTGDNDCNIRSLLRAQLCHGFASSATPVVLNLTSSVPARIQKNKPVDVFRRSMSLKENDFFQMDTNIKSTDYMMCPGLDSALFATAFHFEGTQKTRGTGTYIPQMSACYMERASEWRGNNNPLGNHNHLHTYHSTGFYPTRESKPSENGTHEALPTQRRFQGRRRRLDVGSPSPHAIGSGDQINGYVGGSCRIEFGSIGNLAEEVISGSAVKCSTLGTSQDPTVMTMRDRVAGQSIHLKNEDEFPPLCL